MRPHLPRRAATPALMLAAALALCGAAGAAPLSLQPTPSGPPMPAAGSPAVPSTAWRQQFDDPVLTALLAPLAPQDHQRAQALARQWVAVRVFHAQWSTLDALTRLAQDTQAALMDLPPETEGRAARLAQVASQIEQTRRLGTDLAARRDQAIEAVAQLAGTHAQALVARIGAPLSEWRLPHLVAEPPTVRLAVSPATSTLAQRLTTLHTRHEAALQADRAALAARQHLAQVQRQAQAQSHSSARQGSAAAQATDTSGADGMADAQPTDPASAQAWQDLLLALNVQAGAAGDLALAWLDYLAVAPAPGSGSGVSQLSHRTAARST